MSSVVTAVKARSTTGTRGRLDPAPVVAELARRTGVAASALRYYEERGLLPAPGRISGQRRYSESPVGLVGIIMLLRDVGFSLAEQRAFMTSRAVALTSGVASPGAN